MEKVAGSLGQDLGQASCARWIAARDYLLSAAALEEDDRLEEIRVDAASCGRVLDQRPETRGPLRRNQHTAGALRVEDVREPKGG